MNALYNEPGYATAVFTRGRDSLGRILMVIRLADPEAKGKGFLELAIRLERVLLLKRAFDRDLGMRDCGRLPLRRDLVARMDYFWVGRCKW